ncbi:MAG: M18 family aminopeptidase [Dermatophilaceae bacterium]
MPGRYDTDAHVQGLIDYVDASPTPFHAVAQAARRLGEAGFGVLEEREPFPAEPGGYLLVRGGSLLAWHFPPDLAPWAPFRIVTAHTDSPNLRVKPRPDHVKAGWQMLGVAPYGGLLANSWLDRDLGLAGRVAVRTASGPQLRLFHDNRPLLRVAQLAIHLDRGVNEQGLILNRQQHLVPLWGLADSAASFPAYLGERVRAEASDVLAWDAMVHDTQPAQRIGRDGELVAAPRLDNLATAYAGVQALVAAAGHGVRHRLVLALFDHEEVGSESERGARSPLLPAVLERIVGAAGGGREDFWRALADSVVASGDMAHATHPNYADRHEPDHAIAVNAGPVLKIHPELRYATDAPGAASFRLACEQVDVPMQTFVVRGDLPCGSTVGPMTAAGLGVTTVDVGAPMLSMHSARELGGSQDPAMYAAALAAFLAPHRRL